jgi:tetratricopeptide (TPR) repeat protein
MSLSSQYSKFDDLYDSDEDREKEAKAARRKANEKRRLEASLARAFPEETREQISARAEREMGEGGVPPSGGGGMRSGAPRTPSGRPAGPTPMMGAAKDLDPSKMTKKQQEQFVDSYAKIFNQNRPKTPYKFPETLDEQRAKCDEADALRLRGNTLFKAGDVLEAAKLYEQAVLKFADWYADCFATDEERALVLAVKSPCHLNLAACSQRLGNHQHAVTHCTSVLDHEKHNDQVGSSITRGLPPAQLDCPPPTDAPHTPPTLHPRRAAHQRQGLLSTWDLSSGARQLERGKIGPEARPRPVAHRPRGAQGDTAPAEPQPRVQENAATDDEAHA